MKSIVFMDVKDQQICLKIIDISISQKSHFSHFVICCLLAAYKGSVESMPEFCIIFGYFAYTEKKKTSLTIER